MIADVTRELERYGEYADRVAPAITFEELTDRRTSDVLAQVESRQAIPNWAVAVAAGLVMFVLIGGFVWLVRGTSTGIVAEPMVTSDPVPSTVTSAPVPSTVTSVPSTVTSAPVPSTVAPVAETGPPWVETELRPSDADPAGGLDGNWFGLSVAVDGDRIVIGSPTKHEGMMYAGAVYVYEPNGDGGWAETKLVASDGAIGAGQLGMSVAVDGDVVVAGRPFELDPDGGPPETTGSRGAVHVFEWDGDDGWAETKLTASDAADLDQFGSSVAVSGDRIVVGAGGDDERSGALYVFERGGQGDWVETKLTASDRAPSEYFGYWASTFSGVPVAIEGDRIAVGSRSAVYVFESDGSGGWAETRLEVSAYRVALDGDRLVIGTGSGVYTYERDGTEAWNETDVALATPVQGRRWLDASGGRIALVDAAGDSPGLAYVLERDGEGDWIDTVLMSSESSPIDDGMWSHDSWVVAVDGDRVVVGAPYAFANGVAYVYERSSD